MEDRVSDVDRLQARLGVRWDAIQRARAGAAEKRVQLNEGLANQTTDDASLIVFGSLAGDEWTARSDVDWTLLKHQDAADDPIFRSARELGDAFQRGLNEIFLPERDQAFYRLTRIYGVF